ncbi:MAG TPA: hypothetical protein VN633_11115 [Bryobacteraceae bacterium]|nr:hypothetical protein [Bryobacteraceae bacterium]
MSFLDNLENNLKSLENQEERDGSAHQRREAERAATLAAAPWAEELKTSAYTKDLMNKAAETGHKIRAKVYMAWLGTTLRLEARGKKLELRPTSGGIQAAFLDGAEEVKLFPVNLQTDPAELLNEWASQLLIT